MERSIGLRPHARPATKSIWLIADLEGEKLRTYRACHVSRLSGRFLRRAGCEVEPVDEAPAKGAQEAGETIDREWGDDEVLAGRRSVLRPPQRAFAGVAADAQHTLRPERAQQPQQRAIVGG